MPQLSEIRKTVITALGLIVSVGGFIINDGGHFIPTNIAAVISAAVGLATIALTYLAPNEATRAARVAGRSVRLKGEKPAAA